MTASSRAGMLAIKNTTKINAVATDLEGCQGTQHNQHNNKMKTLASSHAEKLLN